MLGELLNVSAKLDDLGGEGTESGELLKLSSRGVTEGLELRL